MAITKVPAVTKQAVIACTNAPTAVELVSIAPMSPSSARPRSSLTTEPTVYCTQGDREGDPIGGEDRDE